ncbi:MAG: ribbon-helix-helix protein, CopG family [Candidatus Diapherotrites archaeon]|nr:ribbon-helix-helix protein, CopG family [Candidatus Diapherotrites archaeon]
MNVVNNSVYSDVMVQVQLRVPKELVKELDEWVKEGRFGSRSDAIKTIIALYEEREKTREFYKMPIERSKEAKKKRSCLYLLRKYKCIKSFFIRKQKAPLID